MQQPGVAIALALLSAGGYATAAVLQQREAARHDVGGIHLVAALVRRPRWWAGVAATVCAALLHLAALAFGPLTMVQPLGVTALVLALPLGARLAGRVVSPREWGAAAAVVAGLLALLTAVPHHAAPPAIPLGSIAGVAGLVGTLAAIAPTLARRAGRAGPVVRAAAAATCFGFTSAMARVVMAGSGPMLPAIGCGLAAAAAGLVLAQTAYRDGGLGAPLATLTLVDPLVAAAIGVTLLGEPVSLTPVRVLLGGVGLLLTSAGLAALAGAAQPAVPGPRPRPALT